MRTVLVFNIMSIDGYYNGPGGDVMVMNMDAAFDDWILERMRRAGTVLLGRKSFQMFSSYWPGIADAPEDPDNRALSDVNRESSRIYNQLQKAVVTDSDLDLSANVWRDTTTVVRRTDVASWLETERNTGSGDIVTYGSRTMWNSLLEHGLIDELHLMIGPEAVGGGTPVFAVPARLNLLEARTFEGSHNVLLRYRAR